MTGAEAKLTNSYQVLPAVLLNLPPLLLPSLASPHPEEVFWNPKALTPHNCDHISSSRDLLEIVFLCLEVLLSLPQWSCSQAHSEDPEALAVKPECLSHRCRAGGPIPHRRGSPRLGARVSVCRAPVSPPGKWGHPSFLPQEVSSH